MHALEVKNFTKRYGKNLAVDDISFTVEPGEFFGLLGPNGAGKSTTIHAITGIARTSGGMIKVFGTDVESDYRDARRKVGLSPQEFNIDIFEKVRDTLTFVAGFYGMHGVERKKRVEEVIKRFGLEKHADKRFKELSGGLKRRVMLARALVHKPQLLILDEPTAGVDVELRHELWKHLQELNKEGMTIILTSHYLEEVELLCSRIAIINHGKIVKIGSKKDLLKDGKHLEELYLSITQSEDAAPL
ncbi:MAG TPA: ABC transporter ATP-binding protein [Candidatus Paceibacterota bacterium]|nr:ABC transporter ATP-binding protein [Candidatus Paceibacterota bacterium]